MHCQTQNSGKLIHFLIVHTISIESEVISWFKVISSDSFSSVHFQICTLILNNLKEMTSSAKESFEKKLVVMLYFKAN